LLLTCRRTPEAGPASTAATCADARIRAAAAPAAEVSATATAASAADAAVGVGAAAPGADRWSLVRNPIAPECATDQATDFTSSADTAIAAAASAAEGRAGGVAAGRRSSGGPVLGSICAIRPAVPASPSAGGTGLIAPASTATTGNQQPPVRGHVVHIGGAAAPAAIVACGTALMSAVSTAVPAPVPDVGLPSLPPDVNLQQIAGADRNNAGLLSPASPGTTRPTTGALRPERVNQQRADPVGNPPRLRVTGEIEALGNPLRSHCRRRDQQYRRCQSTDQYH
jgi:hypothetical protein